MVGYYQKAGCLTEEWLVLNGRMAPRPGALLPSSAPDPVFPAAPLLGDDKRWLFGQGGKAVKVMSPDGEMPGLTPPPPSP